MNQEVTDIRVLIADSSLVMAFQRGDQEAKTILISRFADFLDCIAESYSGTGIEYLELREIALTSFLRTMETWSRDTELEYAEFALKSICGRLENYIFELADHLDIAHIQTDFHCRLVQIAAQLSHDIPDPAELPGLVYTMVNRLHSEIDLADEVAAENIRGYTGVDIEMVGKLLAAQSLACYLEPAGVSGPFERIEPAVTVNSPEVNCTEIGGDSDFDYKAALEEIDFDQL
jgi:hypothetical protein